MNHVAKKPKVESDEKENSQNDYDKVLRDEIRSGQIMQYASSQRPSSSDSYSSHFAPPTDNPRAKKPWEYRIPEVLAMNLELVLKTNNEQSHDEQQETHGDISNLCLHSSFFVQGVRIGWPFPVIMPPQRQVSHDSVII